MSPTPEPSFSRTLPGIQEPSPDPDHAPRDRLVAFLYLGQVLVFKLPLRASSWCGFPQSRYPCACSTPLPPSLSFSLSLFLSPSCSVSFSLSLALSRPLSPSLAASLSRSRSRSLSFATPHFVGFALAYSAGSCSAREGGESESESESE